MRQLIFGNRPDTSPERGFVRQFKGADVASATTTVIGTDGNFFDVTGTTTITRFTIAEGRAVTLQFDGALTLTHHATNLNLPGGANITTAAGDILQLWAYAANKVYGVYTKAVKSPGGVLQVVNTQTGAATTGTTTVPIDDTIPQNTEGDEYMTLAITPKSATSKLKIEVVVNLSSSAAAGALIAALFQDSTAGALAAAFTHYNAALQRRQITFTHYMTSGTTSATTFKVRAGSNSAGTTTFNGASGSREFGGVMASSITITEIAA